MIAAAPMAQPVNKRSRPPDDRHPGPLDLRGTVLVSAGMGLAVLGLQESSDWGWGDPLTWICILGGGALLAVFGRYQLRAEHPLLQSIRTVFYAMAAVMVPAFVVALVGMRVDGRPTST
jgi:hypothetical protein